MIQKSNNLEECLNTLATYKYHAYGYEYFLPAYQQLSKQWSVAYRNAADFSNPKTDSPTLLEACHKMIDFLNKKDKDGK